MATAMCTSMSTMAAGMAAITPTETGTLDQELTEWPLDTYFLPPPLGEVGVGVRLEGLAKDRQDREGEGWPAEGSGSEGIWGPPSAPVDVAAARSKWDYPGQWPPLPVSVPLPGMEIGMQVQQKPKQRSSISTLPTAESTPVAMWLSGKPSSPLMSVCAPPLPPAALANCGGWKMDGEEALEDGKMAEAIWFLETPKIVLTTAMVKSPVSTVSQWLEASLSSCRGSGPEVTRNPSPSPSPHLEPPAETLTGVPPPVNVRPKSVGPPLPAGQSPCQGHSQSRGWESMAPPAPTAIWNWAALVDAPEWYPSCPTAPSHAQAQVQAQAQEQRKAAATAAAGALLGFRSAAVATAPPAHEATGAAVGALDAAGIQAQAREEEERTAGFVTVTRPPPGLASPKRSRAPSIDAEEAKEAKEAKAERLPSGSSGPSCPCPWLAAARNAPPPPDRVAPSVVPKRVQGGQEDRGAAVSVSASIPKMTVMI